MNLAALPKDSEELGLAGYGACRVELYPIESADEVTGRQVLDLDRVGDEAHDLDVRSAQRGLPYAVASPDGGGG